MPPKDNKSAQLNEESTSSRKYNLRQNKKGKQVAKKNARDSKSYTEGAEDAMDLPEGIYDASCNASCNANKLPDSITKETFKKNIVEEHSPSNSPPISDDEHEELVEDENAEVFDDAYFEPVPYDDSK